MAVFPAPPADITHLDVIFPQAPPFLDVPLGEAAPTPLRVDDGGGDPVDPNSSRVGEPVVLSIVNQVEQAGAAQDDDGRQVSVRLSTDVLFAVNKADLSPKARTVLKDVAAQIDRSRGEEVAVDGHTDDTGTDGVNDPLSRRRARSVQNALEKLVTRSGVAYRARGHGSHEPIASPVLGTAPAGKAPDIESDRNWPRRAEVRINELTRDAGGYVNLVWTIRNDDDIPINAWSSSYDWGGVYAEASTSGAALVDGPRRYRPLRDAKHNVGVGPYLLSVLRPEYLVAKGEEYTLWAMFKPPADVRSVTVRIPGFEPVADLPIR
ncbi:OmpA family protein [Nonomuraea sp. NPDC048881]|uniref:OmpA family protein n=1 Tax=Nonomuraea sp. NPDC048881 TaxID=3155030 RepID=UPI0033CAE1F4